MKHKSIQTPFSVPPEAIIVTFGQAMMSRGGKTSPAAFERYFLSIMREEDSIWYHKSKNKPLQDVAFAYIIMDNYLQWRVNYIGHEKGDLTVFKPIGDEGEEAVQISWPRMVFCGPIVNAPEDIPMQGFQGFRYTHKLF